MAFFTGGQHPRCAERLLVRFLPRLNFVPRFPRKGANGGKREGERSEQESVVTRLNLSLRQNKNSSFPGHAPGKDTLRAANAATKEGVNGGENGLSVSDYPLSSPST